jgi:cytochrome b561
VKLHDHIRNWATDFTKQGKYSPVGVWFHWIMAALVLYQLYSGWAMLRYPAGGDKLQAYATHSELGLSILLLAILRGLWRLFIPDPINAADRQGWKTTAAHATHIAFYVLFALLPLSGWSLWSAIQPARPLYLAGLVRIPPMPFYDLSPAWQYHVLDWAEDIHVAGVIGLCLLLPLHVGAALKHHFWDRDDVVIGILPEIPDDPTHPQYGKYNRKGG